MTIKHEIEIDKGEQFGDDRYDYLDVEFECELAHENSGIGSYEFWGFKGYDAGQDYMIAEEITWYKEDFTEHQNKFIDEWLNEEKNYNLIEKYAIEKYYDNLKNAI